MSDGRLFKDLADQSLKPALFIPTHADEFDACLVLSGPTHLGQSHIQRSGLIRSHDM